MKVLILGAACRGGWTRDEEAREVAATVGQAGTGWGRLGAGPERWVRLKTEASK